MSTRLQMLQVARLAPELLGEAAELVDHFIQTQLITKSNQFAGFKDRAGNSDLYYSVFGLENLLALKPYEADSLPAHLSEHLNAFQEDRFPDDFIHVCCLTHCWHILSSLTGESPDASQIQRMLDFLESHRSTDGGFNVTPDSETASSYGNFMAFSAYQNLKQTLPHLDQLITSQKKLLIDGQGFANDRMPESMFENGQAVPGVPTVPATSAAVSLLKQLNEPVPLSVKRWLLKQFQIFDTDTGGGFKATPGAPMPDLLSTATALHALSYLHADIEKLKEPCLDFIDSLWTNQGSFYGNWGDDQLDVEYTFYGLLALGHLK